MDLREIDLNLLVVFNQLLLDRSVSTSAEKLGLTQPAVSNALKRLRAVLKDELFLRTSRGMEPTPYALHLAEPVIYALNTLQTAFTTRDSFTPETSTRNFQLAMTDIGEMYFMPPLMVALSKEAPHVRVSTVRPNAGNLKEDMESGTVDLALGLLPNLQTGFFQRRLFRHKYVCVFRKGHPLAKSPMTLNQFSELDHVGVVAANTGHSEVDGLLERAGIKRKMRLVVPHFIAVGHILQTTDLIATLPERFAERCEVQFGLATSPHPARLPEIAINLFWHAKVNRDPANMWIRQLFVKLFADSDGKQSLPRSARSTISSR
jgi:DNA-binding transcriptional LysR family regulator